jgi:hypothetical protein
MGPLVSHTLIAHWGQTAIIFPLAYLQQRFLFKLQVKKIFPSSTDIKNRQNISRV